MRSLFYRHQHNLIVDAMSAAQASQTAALDNRRAELAATEHELARTGAAIDRYLAASENSILDPKNLAGRLASLKARSGVRAMANLVGPGDCNSTV